MLCNNPGQIESVFTYNVFSFFFSFFLFRQKADMPATKHRLQLTTWQVFRHIERRFHSLTYNVLIPGLDQTCRSLEEILANIL